MGKKSKTKQKKNENIIKPLIQALFQKCVHPTGSTMPSPRELFDAYKEIADMLAEIEKYKGTGFVDQMPNREKGIEEFYNWARDHSIVFDNVEIKCTKNDELGMFAKREMLKGDNFVNIPRSAMMASDCLNESSIGAIVDTDPMLSSMPNVALALHLLCEVYNEQSKWKPYINILPRHYNNILYFEIDDIENLKGTSIFLQAINTLRSIVRQYAYLSNLFYKHPVAKKLDLANKFTYADYKWAVATLMTRQNPIPSLNGSVSQVIALIPFLDLCNHKEGPVSIDYNPEAQQCECFLMHPVTAGEEVLIHYGPRPNPELVVFNGFFYKSNKHDFVKLKLSLSKSDPNYDLRQNLITKLGLEESLPLGCIPSPIKDSLKAFLLVANSTAEEIKGIQELDRAELAVQLQSENSFCKETKIKGMKMLKDRCELCMKLIPGQDDDVEAFCEDGNVPSTKRLSLQLRMNERRILRDSLSYVTKELDLLQGS